MRPIFVPIHYLNLFPMKSSSLYTCILALFLPLAAWAQQAKKADIEVSPAVLQTAEWAKFKYKENLEAAKTGDSKALRALFEFSGTVDGAEALQHTTTCLELLTVIPDDLMGAVISSLKPKLKTVLLERFPLAQGQTKKTELHKPLSEFAPNTWKALNGAIVSCNSCMHEQTVGQKLDKKPGQIGPAAAKPAAQTTDKQ